MDNQIFNYPMPTEPSAKPASFWRKHLRTIALSGFGLLIAVGFLAYTGGFSSLAKIFGSKAGTELVFAGYDNLMGNQNAEKWVIGNLDTTTDAGVATQIPFTSFNGSGAFTSFTGVPGHSVNGTADESFIMPVVTSLTPDQDTFTVHNYYSPALDLGSATPSFNQTSIYAYLPETATAQFSYRTSAELTSLMSASWTSLTPTFAVLPTNENIKSATIPFGTALSRYVQLSANFETFDAATGSRPAVYGWVFNSNQTDGEAGLTAAPSQRTLTMTYTATNAPADAVVKIVGDNPDAAPLYTQANVNLSSLTQYQAEVTLPAGAYAIIVTSPTTQTKTVAFELSDEGALTIDLGDFAAGTGEANNGSRSADLNGDGSVDSLDASILLDQLAQP